MSANPYATKLAAYTQVSAHSGVAAADPHKLILMLLDGALERLANARGCMVRNESAQKAQLIHRTVCIIGELQGSLDLKTGGAIAANLHELYDYMTRKLLLSSTRNSVAELEEVSALLQQVRDAWAEVPGKLQSPPR